MIKKILIIITMLLPITAHAQRETFLRSPQFDWNSVQTITTTQTLPSGLKMIRIEHVTTGCVLLIIENTDLIVNDQAKCDKYINERDRR